MVAGPLIPRKLSVVRCASVAVYEEKDDDEDDDEEADEGVSVGASARTRDRKLPLSLFAAFPPKLRAPAMEDRATGLPLRARAETFIVAAVVAAVVIGCVPRGRAVASGLFHVERPDDSLM